MTELTILNRSGRVLISSLDISPQLVSRAASPERSTSSRHFIWQKGRRDYLACYWDLFLKARFGTDRWTVVLSQTRSDALTVIKSFKYNFPLALLLGFWIILLFSIRFIRKSLVPLEELQNATHRIRSGNFSHAVTVESNDEFQDLADSFNLMSRRLAHTFGELTVMAEIGHFVTTRPEVADLAVKVLQTMAANLDYDWGLFMVAGDVLASDNLIFGYGLPGIKMDGPREVARLDEQPEMVQLMAFAATHQGLVYAQDTAELGPKLPAPCANFIARTGCTSVICAPVRFEQVNMGILAVGKISAAHPLAEGDQQLMASTAAHTAVAINNIITFRKLAESETRFRQAFDHAATGIALVSPDLHIQASNRYLQDLLGYTEGELVGKSLAEIEIPEDRSIGRQELARILEGRQILVQTEKRCRHREGRAVWTRIHGSLLRDSSGYPLHFIFHIQDLSSEKQAEKNQRQLETQLRQAQKMEAIGTLAGGIAHDFNNILAAISGYNEMALMQLPDDSDLHRHLSRVKKGVERAANLVWQILTFSRQSENEKAPLRISSVVKEALQLLRASLPATIEIRKNIDDASLVIMADPTQIHQIVMNLCTNALHAMEETGGVLSVILEAVTFEDESVPASDGSLKPGRYLRLTVADTGCGMDDYTLSRIFDPYFTTKEKDKGTGLGLAVVHGIVQSHEGTIRATSMPGEGTTFDIYFPVTEPRDRGEARQTEAAPGGSEHVLFVDDEPMLVDLAEGMLKSLGYRVTATVDPRTALELFKRYPGRYDIVITDFNMPGIRGDKLARKIEAIRPDIPILLVSGYITGKFESAFFTGYLYKPFTQKDLAQSVRRALDRCASAPG
jgi:PAS domain S-box-containing protein